MKLCVALLSVWFVCFGFIYQQHRVSQSTNWYFAKQDGYKRENESSATWSVKCRFDRTFLLLSFVRSFVSESTISFRFVSQSTVSQSVAILSELHHCPLRKFAELRHRLLIPSVTLKSNYLRIPHWPAKRHIDCCPPFLNHVNSKSVAFFQSKLPFRIHCFTL